MKRRTRSGGQVSLLYLVALGAAMLAYAPETEARIGSLSVSPAQPGCTDSIVVRVSGWFPDGCHQLQGIDFSLRNNAYVFEVHATDLWVPGTGCAAIVIPYSAVETVGPLPAGQYFGAVVEDLTSQRFNGETDFVPFEVVCCAPQPESVERLRLDKLPGDQLNLTWNDTATAVDYVVFEDDLPSGDFDMEIGSSNSGEVGVDISMPSDNAFYLVAGRNACGTGTPR